MIPRAVMFCLLPALIGMAGGAVAESSEPAPAAPAPEEAAPAPAAQAQAAEADDTARECSTCTARHRGLQRLQDRMTAPDPD